MALLMLHPEVAMRDCEHCKKWWYDDKTGEIHKRHGKEVLRPTPPPCETHVGCPKGHWRNPKTLNERNYMAYQHYQECRAVSSFPDDGVARHNASVIREIEDLFDRKETYDLAKMSAFGSAAKGGNK